MKTLFSVAFLFLELISFGQQFVLDPSFINSNTNSNSIITSTSKQLDGKTIVGGDFNSYNGVVQNNITRLNLDGTIDPSFSIGSGFNGLVYTTCIQPDGKILVGGAFSTFNGIPRNKIVRLNLDGSLDASFNIGSGIVNGGILDIAVQTDGKIIIGGGFSAFNGTPINNIARLNSDGTLDLSFSVGSGFIGDIGLQGEAGYVRSICLQSNGKVLVGGGFTNFNGVARNGIARLNFDGTIDSAFDIGSGFNNRVFSVKIQSNNQIIVTGEFTTFNGAQRNKIIRLNSDGTIDPLFNIGTGFNGTVWTTCLQSNEKILVGGSFSSFNGILQNAIARLNPNGSLDTSTNIGTGFNGVILEIADQTDGKIIIGGSFSAFNGTSCSGVTRFINCMTPVSHQTIYPIVCNYYTSVSNNIYTESGIYNEVLHTALGCDSVYLTIDLTVQNSNTTSYSMTICSGDTYTWNGQQYSQPGQYTQTFVNQYGCDSVVTLDLSFNLNNISSNFSSTICPGNTYTWNGQQYNSAGQYQQTFTNQFGCDSVVTLNLTVLPNNFNPTFSSANQLYTAPPFAVQFTNSTANASNYSFTWDFGDGTTLASNNASVFHQYLYNGLYTVSLIATNNTTGCSDTTTLTDYIFCTGGVSCTHTATINQTSPQQACQGNQLWLSCNNDPSFTYQWRRNGVIISGNNNDSLLVTQSGTYSVIISVNNCPVISGDVVVNISPAPTTPIIASSGTIQPCVGGSVVLTTGSYSNYNWSTGATTQSINVSNSGTYTVTVSSASGCSATSAPFTVNASFVLPPQVCIVGIDSLTNENRIVWEKPISQGIDSFYVYKESNVSNVYTKIGTTDYNDLAVFLDANSNPAVQAYRYKISALDTCGTETPLSDFHKTIHLTINQGVGNSWNLIWSHYEGIDFGSYNIYRGTDPTNISLFTTIQSNLNSYTDLTPPTGPLYYQIEVVNPNNCDPTKIMNYGVSKSNIVNNGLSGLSEEVLSTLNIYPNPTNDKFTLNVSNDLLGKNYLITDFSGRVISQGKINSMSQTIDIQEVSKGSYLLQIDKSSVKAIKLIKQ